ncbi:MAG: hypothetical protein AAF694_14940 [Bacteroidota bacterium]
MVYSLRRRHLFIWIFWAVLIPIGLYGAFSVVGQQEIPLERRELYPVPLSSQDSLIAETKTSEIIWTLWKGKDSTSLEVFAKVIEPLSHPSAFVYVVPNLEAPLSSAEVIGGLGPVGNYSFSIATDWITAQGVCLIVHDPIKSETFHSIELIP